MRELKFRVWSKKQKTYDYKHPYNTLGNFYINQNGCLFSDYGNAVTPEIKQGDFVVERYTGLRDKNGKEIYEGDIVKYEGYTVCFGVVEYDAPEFYLNADVSNWGRMIVHGIPYQTVIGNIHENPELLEAKE